MKPSLQHILRCPCCRSPLAPHEDGLVCTADGCGERFPIVTGVPILVCDRRSLFSRAEYQAGEARGQSGAGSPLKRLVVNGIDRLPGLALNVKAAENYARLARLLVEQAERPRVLIVGGRIVGRGMHRLLAEPRLELVETDVGIAERTQVICDAHDLPFADASFDGVVVQAVLEHVLDPTRCVGEIHRVLRTRGLVYAETPFMQQVHEGGCDFTRFTHLGHRRLFRWFDEVDSGACCGPGMALSWSYSYFLRSFSRSRRGQRAADLFARLTAFWLKYFDYFLTRWPGAFDSASGYYLLGRKAESPLPDRELIRQYRGCQILPGGSPTRSAAACGMTRRAW